MNNYGSGKQGRGGYIGGRPKSDADYGPKKKRFDKKPGFRTNNERPAGNRELFKTTCTSCGKACEVPFRPDGSKPVLCRDCFVVRTDSNDRQAPRSGFTSRPERHDNRTSNAPAAPAIDLSPLYDRIKNLEAKLDYVVALVEASVVTTAVSEAVTEAESQEESVIPKKKKKVAIVKKAVKKTATKKSAKKTKKK